MILLLTLLLLSCRLFVLLIIVLLSYLVYSLYSILGTASKSDLIILFDYLFMSNKLSIAYDVLLIN